MNRRVIIRKMTLPLTVICALLLGALIGMRVSNNNLAQQFMVMQRWNKLNAVLSIIGRKYVDSVDVRALEEKTIVQTLKSLDPHSAYIPASLMAAANEEIDGKFEGIGIFFNMLTDTVQVINVVAGGPSQRVGIAAGDKIVVVNDNVVAGCKIGQDSIMRLLRGRSGTKVNVGVLREGVAALIPFAITRGSIPIRSVEAAYLLTPKTGFIKLSKFSRTTYSEVSEAAERLQDMGMENLVLDLRGNGGGLLDQALDVLGEFFEKGTLLVYTQGYAAARRNFTARGGGVLRRMPLAVLIDENSASASEIVAGAIQDNERGEIIGRRSFGKALVQEAMDFSDGSGMRLTTARYYTPTGRCIQRPYDKGEEAYYQEFWQRFERGELASVDSIVQNEDLLYQTPSGKIVYGGGGITPDIFVPLDTAGMNAYYLAAARSNLVYRFASRFADAHRGQLQKIETMLELKRFLYYRNFGAAFSDYAERNGIAPDKELLRQCQPLLNAQIKGLAGRTTALGEAGYYVFINGVDKTVQMAIRTLEMK